MPNLVLTRKAGESLTLIDKAGNKLVLVLKAFTPDNATFKANENYHFDLNPHENVRILGGSFCWAPSKGRTMQIRMILDFPRSVNIVRTEIAK